MGPVRVSQEESLVAIHWHPAGAATLVLESGDGTHHEVQLTQPGSFAFIPRGTWHTARVSTATTMFFITPGEGTQHRPA